MGLGTSLTENINLNSSLSREQQEVYQNPEVIKKILYHTRTIAMVGLSTERQKASYFVATYLRSAGYRIIPVYPRADRIFGVKCYPILSSLP